MSPAIWDHRSHSYLPPDTSERTPPEYSQRDWCLIYISGPPSQRKLIIPCYQLNSFGR